MYGRSRDLDCKGRMIVRNCPAEYDLNPYLVVTLQDGELWYYDDFSDYNTAVDCVREGTPNRFLIDLESYRGVG